MAKKYKFLFISIAFVSLLVLLLSSVPYFGARTAIAETETSRVLEAVPAAPTLVAPSGIIGSVRPLYTWQESAGATQYRILVSNTVTGTVLNKWYCGDGGCEFSSTYEVETEIVKECGEFVCLAGECSLKSPIQLRTGNHTWWMKAANAEGVSSWSSPMNFRVWNSIPPSGSVTQIYPYNNSDFLSYDLTFYWTQLDRASWYKVLISDQDGKLYYQIHRAADICYKDYCYLPAATYEPLLEPARSLSELPTSRWISWYVMPVNVAGDGSWSGPFKFWLWP